MIVLDKLVFSHRLVSGYFKIAWVEPSTRISAYGLKIAVRIANFFTALRIETAISIFWEQEYASKYLFITMMSEQISNFKFLLQPFGYLFFYY